MDKQSGATSVVNKSLRKIAKGTVILFIGAILGMLLAFAGRTMFARFFTPSEYGVFSLGFALFSICTILGTLGLQEGTTREIAYYLGKNRTEEVQSVIIWSIIYGLISGIILFLIIYFCSDFIATRIFNISNLSYPLKILSFSIPFYILVLIITSIFRGFKRVKEKIIFVDFLRNLLFPLLLAPVILFGLSFFWGIGVFSISIIIVGIFFFIYFIIKIPNILKFKLKNNSRRIGRKLLLFSLPLLLVTILYQVISWTDTIMLGYFKTPEVVGLYNAAIPLGRFISTALAAMLFVYTPFVSDLFARGKTDEIRRSYTILTKWLCAATLPLMFIFVLYPNLVLNFFFGADYIPAGTVLQILAIGFFINNLMGPNGATLTALGKTKFLMGATFVSALINVSLNAILIPNFGISGAAIASVIAVVSINIMRSIKLYTLNKTHSLEKNVLKPIILSGIFVFLFYFIVKVFLTVNFWMLPIIFIFFILLYGVSLLFTKSFDKEDIDMLLQLEKKTGINLSKVRRLIEKLM